MERVHGQSITRDQFRRAAQDVLDALHWGLSQRLKNTDDFDGPGFLHWATAAAMDIPATDAQLRARLAERSARYTHRVRTLDFHRRFDINWGALHPDAAHLLYHPDLWSETDPRMPHGNEIGRGILDQFSHYKDKTLREVLTSFGLAPQDGPLPEAEQTRALQVELALVFAHIKVTGTAPSQMVDALLSHMKTESTRRASFWVHRSRHGVGSHLSWMKRYLDHFASGGATLKRGQRS